MAQAETREGNPDAAAGALTPPQPDRGTTEPRSLPDEPTLIRRTMLDLLHHMGFRAQVDVRRTAEGYCANIRTRRSGAILIGHRGATLRAIQHLTGVVVRRQCPDLPPITVDVGGYRERREVFLRRKTVAIATLVLSNGREMALDMLTEKEMHVVRDELAKFPGLRAHAVGDGPRRNVIIAPASGGPH